MVTRGMTLAGRAALAGLTLAFGCTFHVPMKTRIPVRSEAARSATRVEIVAPPFLADREYEASGMFWIGFGHTWKFSIGREVVGSSQQIYRLFFQEVTVLPSKTTDPGSYLLVVEPMIQKFEMSSFSMGTEVALAYEIRDPSNRLIHQSSVKGRSSFGGPQWAGVFLGVFCGKYALSDSASDALDEAYANLVRDLEDAVQRGVLEPSADSSRSHAPGQGAQPEKGGAR